MKNPLFWLAGVEDDIAENIDNKEKVRYLALFSASVGLVLVFSFLVVYFFFSTYLSPIAGVIIGIAWIVFIRFFDSILFSGKSFIDIIFRAVLVLAYAVITSFILGLTISSESLEHDIDAYTQRNNWDYNNAIEQLDKAYKNEVEVINKDAVKDAREQPNNRRVQEAHEQRKKDALEAHDLQKASLIANNPPQKVDYSLGNKFRLFLAWNSLQRLSILIWLFLIIELSPLLIRLTYMIKFRE